MSRAVVLFARCPEREARAKGLHGAAPLFRALVGAWLDAARRSGATAIVACEREDRQALAAIAPELPRLFADQRGVRFGDRLEAAAHDAFALGFERVLVAGIDAPPPPLHHAFDALENGRAVVAPSRDGGVNLIGLQRDDLALLAKIELRRSDVLRICRTHLRAQLVVLPTVRDIDSRSSFDAAKRERAWRAFFLAPRATPTDIAPRVIRRVAQPISSRPPPLAPPA